MTEQEKLVDELAYGLVQALDEWSECLQEVMERSGPSRSGLVTRLRDANPKIDNPLISHWLLGRDQLLGDHKRPRRLPTVRDSARVMEAFRDYPAAQRQRLTEIASRIDFHRTRLHKLEGHRWRSAVVTTLTSSEQPSPCVRTDAVLSREGPHQPPVTSDAAPPQKPAPVSTARGATHHEQFAAGSAVPTPAAESPAPDAAGSSKRTTTLVMVVGLLIVLRLAVKGRSASTEQGGARTPR